MTLLPALGGDEVASLITPLRNLCNRGLFPTS